MDISEPLQIKRIVYPFQHNPFRDQLFAVFSSQNDGRLSFEDFVDLSSVMSVNCPLPVKAAWAFRVFGM